MKKLMSIAVLSFAALCIVSFFSCSSQVPKASLKTAVDSVSYAQGVFYASQQFEQIFAQLELEESNRADYVKGFQEGFQINVKDKKSAAYLMGKLWGYQMGTSFVPYFNSQLFGEDSSESMSMSDFLSGYLTCIKDEKALQIGRDEAQMYSMMAIENIRKEANEKKYGSLKSENQEWLVNNKSQEGVFVLPSGLQYKVIKEGKGPKPEATDRVRVAYEGTTIDGNVFDSNESAQFPLNGVIPGWTEGLQLMSVGAKYMLYVPYELAYGESGGGDAIPPFATLIFEVELLEILK